MSEQGRWLTIPKVCEAHIAFADFDDKHHPRCPKKAERLVFGLSVREFGESPDDMNTRGLCLQHAAAYEEIYNNPARERA